MSFKKSGRIIAGLWAIVLVGRVTAGDAAEAIRWQGETYINLPTLLAPDLLNGADTLENWGRDIVVTSEAGNFRFSNGGNEFVRHGETTRTLELPVQVIDGLHYIPATECAPLLGYIFSSVPVAVVDVNRGKKVLQVEEVHSEFRQWEITNMQHEHRYLETTAPLPEIENLGADYESVTLPHGKRLLLRRTFYLNGTPYGIITADEPSLTSYAAPLAELNTLRDLNGVAESSGRLAQLRRKQAYLTAQSDSSINHGPRTGPLRFAMTIDLCWSLRPMEEEFFACTERLAKSGKHINLTLFVSGRWLQQHPKDMHRLIGLSHVPGLDVEWGLHSWDHPKEGAFMNAYSPEELRADTFKLEAALLEWGVVPSIFYRFPGLMHDTRRLCEILDLDLLSVDCDSWVNMMNNGTPPHRLPARSGSILLIHGNGNEPDGIPKFYDWLESRQHWHWAPVSELVIP